MLAKRAKSAPALPEQIALRTADNRTCVVHLWRAVERHGAILFSHGALSAPRDYLALIAPWVSAGYDVWAPLHVDSTDHPDTKAYPGLASWPARIEDMRALSAHLDRSRYVAAGHSYGALVALTLSGAAPKYPPGVSGPLADRRARAVIAFSPPGPGMGLIDATTYDTVSLPAFIETGTADVPPGPPSPGGWRTHLTAYEAPRRGGERYGLVLADADHYFGGLICRLDMPGPRQTAALDVAVARSIAFLHGFGSDDANARRALRSLATAGPVTSPGLYRR